MCVWLENLGCQTEFVKLKPFATFKLVVKLRKLQDFSKTIMAHVLLKKSYSPFFYQMLFIDIFSALWNPRATTEFKKQSNFSSDKLHKLLFNLLRASNSEIMWIFCSMQSLMKRRIADNELPFVTWGLRSTLAQELLVRHHDWQFDRTESCL